MATTFTKTTTPDNSKSIVHILEGLLLGHGVVGMVHDPALSVAVPSISAGGAGISGTTEVAKTVTGVALGDEVVSVTPNTALPTNARLVGAYVSAADTVTFVFTNLPNAAVTGASVNFSVLLFDRT